MSLSHFRRPFDIAKHPTFEPEIKRAILASWASDSAAVEGEPASRKPHRNARAEPIDEVMSAPKSLDG